MAPKTKTKKQTTPKGKAKKQVTEEVQDVNPIVEVVLEVAKTVAEDIPAAMPQINLDLIPLADAFFKVTDCHCEFELYGLHLWLK